MSAARRTWQTATLLACVVPIAAGAEGVWRGAATLLHGASSPPGNDLDSQLHYLSGLLLGIGLAFVWAVVAIERRSALFRMLGLIVVCGGLARLLSLATDGLPGRAHLFGLAMELGVVPLLMLWQRQIGKQFGPPTLASADGPEHGQRPEVRPGRPEAAT